MPTVRTRTRGGFTSTLVVHTQNNCDGTSSSSSLTSGSLLTNGVSESMTDVVTPNFRKIQKAGGTVFTSMDKSREERSATEGSCTRTRNGACGAGLVKNFQYSSVNDYQLGLPVYMGSSDVAAMEAEALTKALASAKTPSVMGLVDIAEARSTVSGLISGVMSLKTAMYSIGTGQHYTKWLKRNGQRRTAATLAMFISSHWLQYRYNIIPLMLTTNSVLEAYGSVRKPEGSRETFRSLVSQNLQGAETLISTIPNGSWTTKLYATKQCLTKVRGGCLQELITSKCMSTQMGLDSRYLGQALYEMMTFSFVLDWFLNLGDLIAALSPDVGSKILGTWTTTEIVSTTTWRTTNFYGGAGYTTSGGNSSGVAVKTSTSRKSGGTASLTLKTFQGRWVDLIHLSDAIALLAGLQLKDPRFSNRLT